MDCSSSEIILDFFKEELDKKHLVKLNPHLFGRLLRVVLPGISKTGSQQDRNEESTSSTKKRKNEESEKGEERPKKRKTAGFRVTAVADRSGSVSSEVLF
jgi:hypothetical protein